MNYFKITGLENGEPIEPYGVETDASYPVINTGLNPDSARYYEPITKEEYNKLIQNKNGEKKKTFAELKRDLQLGTKVKMVKREVNGKEEKAITKVREISKVQSNAIAFKTLLPDGTMGNSWLHFPKASQVEYI